MPVHCDWARKPVLSVCVYYAPPLSAERLVDIVNCRANEAAMGVEEGI
jgi:hypothetical protein